jgi:hypothetical protein
MIHSRVTESGLCSISGSLNGHNEKIIIDTSASVSLVKRKHILKKIWTRKFKKVTGVSGNQYQILGRAK